MRAAAAGERGDSKFGGENARRIASSRPVVRTESPASGEL
jgi:hypothetical protein